MNATYDLAIVGCGPVGALAANFAGRAGLSTVVIDRELAPHPLPRAVHLDHEMMRLFEDLDLSADLAPLMRETEGHLHVGADRGVIRYMGTAGRGKPFGWGADYFFYQPELEAVLRRGMARFPGVETRFGTTAEAIDQDERGVSLTLAEGPVRARWLVACDGARSSVRKALGIALDISTSRSRGSSSMSRRTRPCAFPISPACRPPRTSSSCR